MAARQHSRAYLEHVLHPPSQQHGTIGSRPSGMQRTASAKNAASAAGENYKPARSSALASTDLEHDEEHPSAGDLGTGETKAKVRKALSVSSTEDDGEEVTPSRFLRISTMTSLSRRSSAADSTLSTQTAQNVQAIIDLLDDENLDDEARIEQVRDLLAAKLKEIEGSDVAAPRLDNIVLSLLHRHREDVRPTGLSFAIASSPSPSPFPASPRSRPRPAILRSGSSTTLTRPWTPSVPTTPTSMTYGSIENTVSPIASPLPSLTGNGGQGSLINMLGSPKASPRLWSKALASSTPSGFASPRPGHSRTGSRSPSPGPHSNTGSPALNVSAAAFTPRSSTLISSTPTKPALSDSRHVKKTALQPDDDSDEDEFSPFVNLGTSTGPAALSSSSSSASSARQIQSGSRPISGVSGNSSLMSMTTADSTSGSYPGSATSTSLDSSDDPRSLRFTGLEENIASLTMTPFDVLTSVLNGTGEGTETNTWSAEQIEEALERKNWDVDATLTAIIDGSIQSLMSNAPRSNTSSSPAVANKSIPTGPSAQRSGVSVVSKEVFATQRAGLTASPGMAESSPRTILQRLPSSGASGQALTSQQGLPAGSRAGLGRVCRFFLAGECRRADCRFSHDLNRALCRFWAKGQCLNGEDCSFLHDLSLLDVPTGDLRGNGTGDATATSEQESLSASEEFPELNLAPTGPRAQMGNKTTTSSVDPTRTRWAQAVQRKSNTPISQVQQGESSITIHGKHGPMHGIPTGPRAAQNPAGQSAVSPARASASRIPLHSPMLLPTLQTGRTASQSYASYREACLALSEKRNKCLARAAEAWKAGNSADARHWSREGQSLNKVIQEESKSLARSIVRSRHDELRVRIAGDAGSQSGLLEAATDERGARGLRGKAMGGDLGVCLGVVPARNPLVPSMAKLSTEERTEVLMDCHLLHASEAVDLIEEFLMALEREQFRGLAMLAVGLGKHTSSQTDRRRVGLASAVKGFLDTWHYPYAEHDGILVVDPINHL